MRVSCVTYTAHSLSSAVLEACITMSRTERPDVPQLIREAMEERRISASELADMVGLTVDAINKMRRGDIGCREGVYFALLDAANYSVTLKKRTH